MNSKEPNAPCRSNRQPQNACGAMEAKTSENGSLTDFFVSDPTIPPPSNPVGFAQKRPLRILITDDNAINRNVVRTIVERLGYNPKEASGGEEALNLLRRDSFNILFTDIDMPKMDGIELAQAVRKHESVNKSGIRKIEIIAVTANIHPDTVTKCKRAGMNGFLEKPVDPETIKKQILKSWRRIKNRSPQSK